MAKFDEQDQTEGFWRLNGWGGPIIGILVILLALVVISASQAEPSNSEDIACADGDCGNEGHGRFGHHRRGHHFFGNRGRDPERAREHMQYAAGFMLKRLDVEDDVQEKIQERLDTAFNGLAPLIEAHKDSRDDWMEAVFGAEQVDRESLEAQRQSAMVAADQALRIVTDAIADVAEMLTPEQRAVVAEKIERHHR